MRWTVFSPSVSCHSLRILSVSYGSSGTARSLSCVLCNWMAALILTVMKGEGMVKWMATKAIVWRWMPSGMLPLDADRMFQCRRRLAVSVWEENWMPSLCSVVELLLLQITATIVMLRGARLMPDCHGSVLWLNNYLFMYSEAGELIDGDMASSDVV